MSKRTEQELLKRIEQLEGENSALRDKLDLIYSIVAPEDDTDEELEDKADDGLVQIREVNEKKVN
jgi:hypothetical protein